MVCSLFTANLHSSHFGAEEEDEDLVGADVSVSPGEKDCGFDEGADGPSPDVTPLALLREPPIPANRLLGVSVAPAPDMLGGGGKFPNDEPYGDQSFKLSPNEGYGFDEPPGPLMSPNNELLAPALPDRRFRCP